MQRLRLREALLTHGHTAPSRRGWGPSVSLIHSKAFLVGTQVMPSFIIRGLWTPPLCAGVEEGTAPELSSPFPPQSLCSGWVGDRE